MTSPEGLGTWDIHPPIHACCWLRAALAPPSCPTWAERKPQMYGSSECQGDVGKGSTSQHTPARRGPGFSFQSRGSPAVSEISAGKNFLKIKTKQKTQHIHGQKVTQITCRFISGGNLIAMLISSPTLFKFLLGI